MDRGQGAEPGGKRGIIKRDAGVNRGVIGGVYHLIVSMSPVKVEKPLSARRWGWAGGWRKLGINR